MLVSSAGERLVMYFCCRVAGGRPNLLKLSASICLVCHTRESGCSRVLEFV